MTIHDPSLRAALKTLKLTGMLDTLDARLAQTRDGKLGHLEFLQVLCEDEIARRETAALARRVRRARFEQPNTFENFDFTVSPKLPAAMLRDLAALRWLEAGESVILYGPVGVGKTHVASTRPASSATRRRHPVRQMLPHARRPRRWPRLILTSNRAPKDWYPLFPNPVVAESLLDRLINTSHQVLMDGPSYRPRKRPRAKTT
jgi:DNA replication protein DnaC